ncbi:hypothetical protein [Bradyrhizobium sp. 2S1]|uniref:hypothetical protein n=1 Tax=Bradyrhizobium sp. 2S1 TaxID=1404429 RepID=UPI00140D8268|nr:hypothetical protein [Bradyrhizobium sp. 2S1]MCK7671494.1 hypothetical protein [Bradyrhizobium sp. 2S1]
MVTDALEVRALDKDLLQPIEVKYIDADRFEFTFRTRNGTLVTSVLNAVGMVHCINLAMKALNEYPTQALHDLLSL